MGMQLPVSMSSVGNNFKSVAFKACLKVLGAYLANSAHTQQVLVTMSQGTLPTLGLNQLNRHTQSKIFKLLDQKSQSNFGTRRAFLFPSDNHLHPHAIQIFKPSVNLLIDFSRRQMEDQRPQAIYAYSSCRGAR